MKSSDVVRALAPEDRATNEEPLTALLFPLRFLGMGLLITWLCCTHVVSIFPGAGFDPALRSTFDYGMRFGDIGSFLLMAIFANRIGRLGRRPKATAFCVALTVLGTAVVGLILIPIGAATPLIFVVAVLTGIGGAVLFCLWAEAYSQMGMTQTVMYGAGSCIVAAVTAFLISTMQPPYAVVATALLPLVSLLCALLSFRLVPPERPQPAGIRYPLPLKLLGMMCLAGLLSGLAGSLLPNPDGLGAIHRIAATGLAGVVIITMMLSRKERIDVRFLAKVGLPLSILALALIPFAGPQWGYAVSFLIKLAYVWFTFFVLLMLANIVFRFEVPSLRLFAIARASSEAAIFVGVAARRVLQQNNAFVEPSVLIGLSLGGIVIVLLCALIWKSETSVNGDWGASGISLVDKLHVPGPRERFMARCDELSVCYKLTTRETEIMALIAQRKSRSEIEHELFLSQNTVKTHVRHLYAKLDVRSKADVIALFER
ncbi:MAG: helix-turn-helix transcriptional regulator [Gordonibacter sp.]|nr:helix-turn-helix transcriptional regulator [Gordonibacter sp.]